MGHEDPFKSTKRIEPVNGTPCLATVRNVPTGYPDRSPVEKQLAREVTGNIQSREWSSPAISNL